ncbi:MAG: hypothetical protein ACJ79L_11015, partial [Anaeromyxobacteraceae bacterium]
AAARREEPTAERLGAELHLARAAQDGPRAAALLAEAALAEPDAARAAALLAERAALLAVHDPAAALEAAREAARRAPRDPGAVDLWAELAAAAAEPGEAAQALLASARLAHGAGGTDGPTRLAEAGAAALAIGLAAEGEAAIEEALRAGLEREAARDALAALAATAARRGDAAAERAALLRLAPLLPTGAKPRALLRLAALAAAAGDAAAARDAAERARLLAPRDPEAIEAARAAALAQGDLAAVAERLADLAAADPASAGVRLLERARLLAGLPGREVEADDAYGEALARLPADAALSAEHARLREGSPALDDRAWSGPLEAYALRAGDARAAAEALREGARLALAQGDAGAALRCARAAFARTEDDPAFAGTLLGRLLYLQGSASEARAHLARLLAAGFPGASRAEADLLARGLAELAAEAGDAGLARAALDAVLAARPHDTAAALRRFALDPDRARAVRELAEAAGATRRAKARAEALATAAVAAAKELRDTPLSDALLQRARVAASGLPLAMAHVDEAKAAIEARSSVRPERSEAESKGEGATATATPVRAARSEAESKGGGSAPTPPTSGDKAALAAAVRRVEEAAPEGRRAALEHGADLAERLGDRGPGAAEMLESLAAERLGREPGAAATDELVHRALDALVRVGENARATALIARAARAATGPARAAWLVRLVDAAVARGDRQAARAAREEALAADPGLADIRAAHLADLEDGGDDAILARGLEAALEAPGADRAALAMRLARARARSGDDRGAELALHDVLEHGPSTPGWDDAAAELARRLARRGDVTELARVALARAEATVLPEARAAAFLAAAGVFERAGDLAAARAAAEQAGDAEPDAPAPWEALARIRLAEGDAAGAARASLAVAIRADGARAAAASLEA